MNQWIIFYNFITDSFEVEQIGSSFVDSHSGEYYFFKSKEEAIKKCEYLNKKISKK